MGLPGVAIWFAPRTTARFESEMLHYDDYDWTTRVAKGPPMKRIYLVMDTLWRRPTEPEYRPLV